MSENGFLREYEDSPISRARRKGLLRNICIGLGTWLGGKGGARQGPVEGAADESAGGESLAEAVEVLIRALNDDRPLVRGHAAWALGQIGGPSAFEALTSRLQVEEDDWVREKCELALSDTD